MFTALGIKAADIGPEGVEERRSDRRRTAQPVRSRSRLAGCCESVFWRRTDRREVRRIVLAAEKYELQTKRDGRGAGRKNGALGPVALEVMRLLAALVDYRSGRLDPSIDYLMAKTERSRAAIVRALHALRTHGFLDWLRRYVPTGAEGRGPQVQQTSNAYRLSLPARAARLLGRLMTPAPAPDDLTHAQELRAGELDAHRASLSMAQRPLFDIEDEGLAASLSRLGRALMDRKERESSRETESQARSLFKR